MDDVLLADSEAVTLEKMFSETKRRLPYWGLQIASEKKKQSVDSILYLDYTINQKKNLTTEHTDQFPTFNHFQKLMGVINWLQPTTG